MKLQHWPVPNLSTTDGFSVTELRDTPNVLTIMLSHLEHADLNVVLEFREHRGVMYCDEFGMDNYVADSPISDGSNFFIALESEFREVLKNGTHDFGDWDKVLSYIIVDTDYWIEVLSPVPPKVSVQQGNEPKILS